MNSHSRPVQFIKRGTAPFHARRAVFHAFGDFSRSLVRSAYTTGTFRGVLASPRSSSSVSLSISTAMLAIGHFYRPFRAIGRKPVMVVRCY